MTTINPASRAYGWIWDDEVDVLHLYISDRDLKTIAAEDTGLDTANLELLDTMGADDPFFRNVASVFQREMADGSEASRLVLDSYDRVIAHHLLRSYSNMAEASGKAQRALKEKEENALVSKAREYLTEHLSENPGLQEVASHVGLSPFHFQRVFKEQMGISPHEFLTQTRVAQARMLLRTDMPIAQVALESGFSSQQYMTTVFSRTLGITPGRYRREFCR